MGAPSSKSCSISLMSPLDVLDAVALGLRVPGLDDVGVELAGLGVDADVLQARPHDGDDAVGVLGLDAVGEPQPRRRLREPDERLELSGGYWDGASSSWPFERRST